LCYYLKNLTVKFFQLSMSHVFMVVKQDFLTCLILTLFQMESKLKITFILWGMAIKVKNLFSFFMVFILKMLISLIDTDLPNRMHDDLHDVIKHEASRMASSSIIIKLKLEINLLIFILVVHFRWNYKMIII